MMICIPYLHDTGWLEINTSNMDYDNQIFAHQEPDGTCRFYDVKKLWQMIQLNKGLYETRQFLVSAEQVRWLLTHHGVEVAHLARISTTGTVRPGIIVEFPDMTQIVVDGNHRYVKLFQEKKTEMTFYVLTEEQSLPSILLVKNSELRDQLVPKNSG